MRVHPAPRPADDPRSGAADPRRVKNISARAVQPVQATVEAARDLSLVGIWDRCPRPNPGTRHAAVRRQEGHVFRSRRPTRGWRIFQGIDRVRGVQADHQQDLSVGPFRRCVSVGRNGQKIGNVVISVKRSQYRFAVRRMIRLGCPPETDPPVRMRRPPGPAQHATP